MLNNYPPHLKLRVLKDLTARAQSGVYVYLSVWLVSAYWADVPEQKPVFFYLNTFILCIFFLIRLVHYRIVNNGTKYKVDYMSQMLILLVLFSALHWGILSAWIFYSAEFPLLDIPYIIILATLTICGSVTLSISREIRVLYPLIMYTPSLLQGFLYDQNSLFLMISVLAVVSYVYILGASKASYHDYYQALINGELAAERARKMQELSNIDSLTQVKNRLYFSQQFMNEWEQGCRQQIPLSIMMLDLDHFKKINDNYGHVYGDQCLKKVAETLRMHVPRSTDTIARYGGEEFVILLTNTSLDTAQKIAERLVKAVSEIKLSKDGQPIKITCSIGLASAVPNPSASAEELLITADAAMYRAKESGRNQWVNANVFGEGLI